MNDQTTAALSPETVMRQMKQNGVTDVVWLPDSETNWLYLLMQADPDLRLVGVTREGHACSIAAGLFAGGHELRDVRRAAARDRTRRHTGATVDEGDDDDLP